MDRLVIGGQSDAIGGDHGGVNACDLTAVRLSVIEGTVMHELGVGFTQVGKVKSTLRIKDNIVGAAQRLAITTVIDRLKGTGIGINPLD